ncbi:MAG: tRNA uridine-5-carboxymethylaminomethyl(34) synthesis GTPase MnmE, partial [Rickettsiales bacterium]|nr:tRNA uridine-5-carboxymethylaminomethyl(34) synthesis GTPase MnmE [Rickettsiales bacterium]
MKADTIYALSSAPGKAGVAVFRISGPESGEMLVRLTRRKKLSPNRLEFARIFAADGLVLDEGMRVFFKAPHSYTGEDSAEIHTHGGIAVTGAMYEALRDAGGRLARPGEFTRRAFENGKLDLSRVRAAADLIDAETESQRIAALRNLDGEAARLYKKWREELLEALAFCEASIDFSEDELPLDIDGAVRARLCPLLGEMRAHIATAAVARRIGEGVKIAIFGRPNVGKSSLFNRITGSAKALVSSVPGTTRDVLEAVLDIGGAKAVLSDTAGIRDRASGKIEKEGIRRAVAAAKKADIKIFVADSAAEISRRRADPDIAGAMIVLNKSDRRGAGNIPDGAFALSAKTGAGFLQFMRALGERARALAEAPRDTAMADFRARTRLASAARHVA